jgi:hypothetical protein
MRIRMVECMSSVLHSVIVIVTLTQIAGLFRSIRQYPQSLVKGPRIKQTSFWRIFNTDGTKLDYETTHFLDWAFIEGIKFPKCEVSMFPGGLRGLRAIDDIEEGEVFLAVPFHLCFTSRDFDLDTCTSKPVAVAVAVASSPSDIPVVATIGDQFDWPVQLALRLVSESRIKKSKWRPYIATLPQSPLNPAIGLIDNDSIDVTAAKVITPTAVALGSSIASEIIQGDSLSNCLPVHWNKVSQLF